MPTQALKPSRSDEIAAILRDEILSGQYRAHERLPSERDLSDRFQTSRGAVREAFKRLEQLGIASVQPGGARVVPVDECNLDLLGPLLDLNDIPDPKLVDEVLHVFGILMDAAAQAAVAKATDAELETAQAIIEEMLSYDNDDVRLYGAMRKLGEFYVSVADHLVLRLMVNGLRTSFVTRMHEFGIQLTLDREQHSLLAHELREALRQRDAGKVGASMRKLNRMFRDSARDALLTTTANRKRISA